MHVPLQELATLKEENEKLRHVRSNMDNEIHELTENLFEVHVHVHVQCIYSIYTTHLYTPL